MSKNARASSSPALRYFGDTRCRSIWQWQLVLAAAVVAIAAGVALLTPDRFADGRFSIGVFAIVAISVGSLAVPWHRVSAFGVLVLPVLDSLAIAQIAAGNTGAATFLWVFPITWVATYYSVTTLVGLLALIGGLRLLNLFSLGITVETTISMIILLITLGFIAVTTATGAARNRASRHLLRAQSSRLSHALQRVNDQKARNRRLLDSLDIGIARVGAGGVIEVSNEAFHRLFALDVAAHLHPNHAVEYRSRRGEPVAANDTAIARASRGELFTETEWLFGLDGKWRAVKVWTKAIDHGIVTGDGLLLLVEDITETVDPRAGETATRRTISHELRNPLTAILGHIDLLLERTDLDESARGQLEVVEHAGSRMQRLIDEALAVPSMSTDDAEVDFDLAEVARASLAAFMPAADSAGVIVEADLDDALDVCGDAFRIRQVVDNVIGNAIKYAQRGGRVWVHGSCAPDGEVVLRVADTGIGISEEDLPRIFTRDFRTELARQSGIPGTGLGLSISREIVVSHGGRFEVQSELGQGTSVALFLPTTSDAPRERTHE